MGEQFSCTIHRRHAVARTDELAVLIELQPVHPGQQHIAPVHQPGEQKPRSFGAFPRLELIGARRIAILQTPGDRRFWP